MKIQSNVRKTIEDILNEYHRANAEHEESFAKANELFKAQRENYTADYNASLLKKNYEAANSAFSTKADTLNKRINGTLSDLRKTVYDTLNKTDKSTDYSIRINNALQFLRAEGLNLTDETAAHILGEFITDIETMKQFRRVIQHQIGENVPLTDTQGKTLYPMTMGYLYSCEELLSAVDEMQETAQNMFMFEKRPGQPDYVNGLTLTVPMDTYSQLMCEHNILEQAEHFDGLCSEMSVSAE